MQIKSWPWHWSCAEGLVVVSCLQRETSSLGILVEPGEVEEEEVV